jgi:hypothetical protein
MYLCYIDESGTSDIPGNTSHFILAGLSVPIWHWKDCDKSIEVIKRRYALGNSEIHIAWILRSYLEQTKITDFYKLDYVQRRSQVESLRKAELLKLQRSGNSKLYRQTKKNYEKTKNYIHLSYDERQKFVLEIARCISQWGFARLFAECIDKIFFDPTRTPQTVDEQSFEQIVSRFEQYLQIMGKGNPDSSLGLLIHDNNQTVAKKHTELMKQFHQKGTLWTRLKNIIETPLFVDSELTSMVQIADVCAYAMRRYLENGEEELFDLIFQRADRKDGIVVGVRHFTKTGCACKICSVHKKAAP